MALLLFAGGTSAAGFCGPAEQLQAKQYGDFDRYVLALSGKPVFVRANTNVIVRNPTNAACKKKPQIKQIS